MMRKALLVCGIILLSGIQGLSASLPQKELHEYEKTGSRAPGINVDRYFELTGNNSGKIFIKDLNGFHEEMTKLTQQEISTLKKKLQEKNESLKDEVGSIRMEKYKPLGDGRIKITLPNGLERQVYNYDLISLKVEMIEAYLKKQEQDL